MKLLLPILFFFQICFISAQTYQIDIPKAFFKIMETKGIGEGIDYLYSKNKWLKEEVDTKELLKKKAKELLSEKEVGIYIGHERITTKSVGWSLAYLSYIVKYDKKPFRFNFVLYKPDRKKIWRLQEFWFDDEVTNELVEKGKIFMLYDE